MERKSALVLSYDEALQRILCTVDSALESENVPVPLASGRALAIDLYAANDVPAFANSAVDGFAVKAVDIASASPRNPIRLPVISTIAAGTAPVLSLKTGQAMRILTGAAVPDGANSIVMVEDTQLVRDGNSVEYVAISDAGSAQFIRRSGSDIPAGALAVSAGSRVDAGLIGLLSALNLLEIACPRRPRVGLIVTGDEIVAVGTTPLPPGKIYNSNGPALAAAIGEAGAEVAVVVKANDTLESTIEALRACAGCDAIVSTGGVSVGEYDYVKKAVEAVGTLDFWRIAIKPGKPLVFGKIGKSLFFGLPGNPVSSLVTFELFVRPVLRKLAGHKRTTRRIVSARLSSPLPHEMGRREFVRAALSDDEYGFAATPTGSQTSHRLSSLVGADAYLIADENHGDYSAGERLPALLLID